MTEKTFYISTPIYFPSDYLHIGHAYCTVTADAIARYKRLRGYDVFFHTGTDEHGQKVEGIAKKQGITPIAYVDHIVESIKNLWQLMDISYDLYYRTTDPKHMKAVQKIFKKLFDQGDIYKGEYVGWYCTPCETFFTETQLLDGKCPDCQREVNKIKEESYFFKLSKYQKQIEELLSDDQFLQPASRRNEMLNNFVKPGLEDLAVSRTSLKWGIPVDFDDKHVVYVWIDALTNYITALGYMSENDQNYKKYWPGDLHLVGKEIVRFHSIIWPAIMLALGEPLPKKVIGTGWIIFDGNKMSKSRGNVIDPYRLVDRYGVDAVRYFLLKEASFDKDTNFTNELLIGKINSDLSNDLGNLLSRTIGMVDKYFGSSFVWEPSKTEFDSDLYSVLDMTVAKYTAFMDEFKINQAIETVISLVRRANKYIDETKPWELAKEVSEQKTLAHILYTLMDILRIISIMLSPIMTNFPNEVAEQLGFPKDLLNWDSLSFGLIDKNVKVSQSKPVFPRLDLKLELAFLEDEKKETLDEKSEISIDDFNKLELRVGTVISCEKAEKSDKLLVSQIKISNETRQIVSGIAEFYKAEEMIGKNVVVVCNLKPIKIRGILSQGMILAASNATDLSVITSDKGNMNGGRVS